MEASTARELIQLLADRSSAWQSLWTVFSTVSAAVVGLVASDKLLVRYRMAASLVAVVGYLVFAVGNYQALNKLRAYHWGLCVLVVSLLFGIPYLQKTNE
jgi:hypothetical protein